MKDDLNFSVSDCFETFPFPFGPDEENLGLVASADAYHSHRAALMKATGKGMTKTLGDFHKATVRSPGIQELRRLHHELDQAVLDAYRWKDLAAEADPVFLTESDEPEFRYQKHLFWPGAFRDKVLARLLALNAQRAAEEAAAGLAPPPSAQIDDGGEADEGADDYAEADA